MLLHSPWPRRFCRIPQRGDSSNVPSHRFAWRAEHAKGKLYLRPTCSGIDWLAAGAVFAESLAAATP